MRIVEVEWEDVAREDDKVTLSCAKSLKPILQKHLGYVIDETEDTLTTAAWYWHKLANGEDMVECYTVIPKRCITGIKELNYV